MPEGDSIFRAARTLQRALVGQLVVRFESVLPALTRVHEDHPLTRRTIERVESIGKRQELGVRS
jgi:endonuclease-8